MISADYADRQVTLVSVLKGALPFMLIMLFMALITIAFPSIATWLPSAIF